MAGIKVKLTVKDEKGDPIDGVQIYEVKEGNITKNLLATTDGSGYTELNQIAENTIIRLRKIKFIESGDITLTQSETKDIEYKLTRAVIVYVTDEKGATVGTTEVIALDEKGNEKEKAEQVRENDLLTGKYAFHVDLKRLCAIQVRSGGFLTHKQYIGAEREIYVALRVANAENRSIQEVIDDYEEISALVTGNSADNDTVNRCCMIEPPEIDLKIRRRLLSMPWGGLFTQVCFLAAAQRRNV